MALTDYLTRSADLLAFDGATPSGDAQLTMQLAAPDEGGKLCVGAQKLAQRFLRTFLKDVGSDPFRPTDGTEFMARLRRGELRNQVDVLVAFAEAQLDCRRLLRAEETAADPADERYSLASVESLAISPGYLQIKIRVLSLAGDARTVILPISVTVR